MNFNDLAENNSLIDTIEDIELLDKLYNEGDSQYSPIRKTLSKIITRENQIKEQERLKNRAIKYYPILKKLSSELDNKYENMFIDIDEYMSLINPNRHQYFTHSKIYDVVSTYIKNYIEAGNLTNKIIDILQKENIIQQMYEYLCPRCAESIFIFNHMPTEEELTERFENEQCVCDTCNEELLADLDFVEETSYYELLVTQ